MVRSRFTFKMDDKGFVFNANYSLPKPAFSTRTPILNTCFKGLSRITCDISKLYSPVGKAYRPVSVTSERHFINIIHAFSFPTFTVGTKDELNFLSAKYRPAFLCQG